MPDTFAHLIPDARAFLARLAANNRRDWFADHKEEYDSALKAPALLLLDQVAHDLGRLSGQQLKPKLFRPHRDVRFSKDKTPYHTHLHMLWTIASGTGQIPGQTPGQTPGLFLGISPDYVRLGGGIMGFDKAGLTGWRNAVDGAFGDEMRGMLDTLAAQGFEPPEPELKRVPALFDKDHRHGNLLRRKGLAVWRDLPVSQFNAPQSALSDLFDAMQPMLQRLQRLS
jgi:uncharacterized protein (TIGR02453 family)